MKKRVFPEPDPPTTSTFLFLALTNLSVDFINAAAAVLVPKGIARCIPALVRILDVAEHIAVKQHIINAPLRQGNFIGILVQLVHGVVFGGIIRAARRYRPW